MKRRSFLTGALAAPALVMTPGLLMPVKPRVIRGIASPTITTNVRYKGMRGTTYEWTSLGTITLDEGGVYYFEVGHGGGGGSRT